MTSQSQPASTAISAVRWDLCSVKMPNQNTTQVMTTGPTPKTIIPKVRYHPTIQTQTAGGRAQATTRAGRTANHCPQIGTNRGTARENQDAGRLIQGSPVGPRPEGTKKKKQKPVLRVEPGHLPTPEGAPGGPGPSPRGLGVQLDGNTVADVEVLTRGQQANPEWFTWRKNRITASVAHSIARCRFSNGKSKTPPKSYLAAVTGEGQRVQTRAMSWGIDREAEAVRRYQRLKSTALGHPVSVHQCGLFIDSQRPWLAASPDGIVVDSRSGKRLLCLEVKCPFKHRQRRVEDACREDSAFCLEIQDEDKERPGGIPAYRLKTSHSYYTQIQCQLAVTGLRCADLVVFTLKETAIVPVTFDPELWKETVSKLQMFYRNAVLPYLKQETQQDTDAEWTPEL